MESTVLATPKTPIGTKRFVFPFITSNKCPLCDVVRETRKNILVHYKSHLKPGIKCGQCSQRYAIEAHLKEHWLLAHPDVPFNDALEQPQQKENENPNEPNKKAMETETEIVTKLIESEENETNTDMSSSEKPKVELVVSLVRIQDNLDSLTPEIRKQFLKISKEVYNIESEPTTKTTTERVFVTLENDSDVQPSQDGPLDLSIACDRNEADMDHDTDELNGNII